MQCASLCACLAMMPALVIAIDFQTLTPLELSKSSPSDYVIADFNNDSHLDLVVVMSGSSGGDGGVSVLLGDGGGGFSNRDFATGAYNAWGVATGDFNRDNHLDLALTTTVTLAGLASRDIHILLGDGTGGFTAHTTVPALQDAPHAVTVGDFNEDGIADLVIGTTQTTSFHAGAADATFAAGQLLSGSSNLSGEQLFSADFNADGHLDVASRQAVYLGAGDGNFTRTAFFAVGSKASADLNGDGHADLISAAGSSLQVWFGNGDGSFVPQATISVGAELAAAETADFDGDGWPDVALVSAGDTAVKVLINNGDGSLAAPQVFATGPQPRLLAVADWDEDGLLDLLVPYNNLGDTPYATRLMQVSPTPSAGRLQLDAGAYSVSEAGPGVTVTLTRTAGSLGSVSIDYATSNGSATAGTDYTAISGTLNFPDGVISQSLVVPILEDALYEGNETFTLGLSNPLGGALLGAPTLATFTIMDNDPPSPSGAVQFSSAAYSVVEDGGSVSIGVTRSGGSFGTVTVDYATLDGSATAGSDYTFASGTLNFADGVLSQSIDIAVLDDTVYEGNETLMLTLSNVSPGASIGPQSSAQLAIVDDDPAPPAGTLQFTAASHQVAESSGGGLITVIRSGGSFGTVTVDFSAVDGSATAGSDYTFASGTLSFADGELSKSFSVMVLDDSSYEGNESLSVSLANVQGGATLGTPASITITIVDDDLPPSSGALHFSNANYSVGEDAGSVSIGVTRSGGSFGSVTVDYASGDLTATAGSDYVAGAGTLTLGDGVLSSAFEVAVLDDTLFEGDESVGLQLSNPTGGAALGTGKNALLTIIENDAPPSAGSLQFSGVAYSAAEDTGTIAISVTRSGGSFGTVSVQYSTMDDTASAGLDYSTSSGVLTFATDEIEKTFSVAILDDAEYEGDERLQLSLASPTGGAVLGAPRTAMLSILENELPPPAGSLQFSGANYVFSEGEGVVNISVTRSGGSVGPVGIDYVTGDGSATAGVDYVPSNGNLLFADGVISATIDLQIIDDNVHEALETIAVILSSPTAGTMGSPHVAEITILDNDPPADSASSDSGGRGGVDMVFALLLWIVILMRSCAILFSSPAAR